MYVVHFAGVCKKPFGSFLVASMLSRELCGILLLALTGISVTGDMVTSKFIEESKWPYWYLVSSACSMAAIFNAIFVYCWQIELPSRADLKWVLARSLLEDLHWCLALKIENVDFAWHPTSLFFAYKPR